MDKKLKFPSERNQAAEAIAYALARGKDLEGDELRMLAQLQDDPAEFLEKLIAAGYGKTTPPA